MEPHGLVYPPELLDRLPVLPIDPPHPSSSPIATHTTNLSTNLSSSLSTHISPNHISSPKPTPTPNKPPIRILTPAQFASLHLQYTLTHPPDNVLFPFLHGLEGDNHAQNAFFATSSYTSPPSSNPSASATPVSLPPAHSGSGVNAKGRGHAYGGDRDRDDPNKRIVPRVPYYRGLVWVVCEDDLERAGDQTTLRILRRKPAGAPGAGAAGALDPAALAGAQPFGLGGEGEVLPSSSSESESGSGSESESEDDADAESEGDSDVLEDEDDDMSVYDEDQVLDAAQEPSDLAIALDPHANPKDVEDKKDLGMMQHARAGVDAQRAERAEEGVMRGAEGALGVLPEGNVGVSSLVSASPASASASASPTSHVPAFSPNADEDNRFNNDDEDPTAALSGPGNSSARRQSSASTTSTSSAPSTSPGLATDTDPCDADGDADDDDDDEDFESVLASPVHLPMGMNVDLDIGEHGVHVVQPSEEDAANGEERISTSNTTDAVGGADTPHADIGIGMGMGMNMPLSMPLPIPLGIVGMGMKKEENYEGGHMHPVVARPAPSLSTGAGVGIPLGLNAVEASPATPSSSASASSRSPSTSSSPSEEGEGEGMELDGDGDNGSATTSSSFSSPVEGSGEEGCVRSNEAAAQPAQEQHEQKGEKTAQTQTQTQTHSHSKSHSRQPTTASHQSAHSHGHSHTHKKRRPTNPASPPLFTSTFRPKELLRRSKSSKLHVPSSTSAPGPSPVSASAAGAKGGSGTRAGGGGGLDPAFAFGGSDVDAVFRAALAREEAERDAREASEIGRGKVPKASEENGDEDEKGWEFVPARVPDGISLRNFGIQVPIYATLSDIVVYSPMGATPAAISLARRFRTAIRAKRLERLQAAGLGGEEDEDEDELLDNNNNGNEDTQLTEQEKLEREERRRRRAEFVKYNVFVLDATEDEMRKTMPHLMMRICGAGVPGGQAPHSKPGCSGSGSGCSSTSDKAAKGCQGSGCPDQLGVGLDIGAHTDGPDGHTIELDVVEEAERRKRERREAEGGVDDVDMDRDADQGEAMDVDVDVPKEKGASASSATLVGEKKKGRPRQHRREQPQPKHQQQQHEEDEDDVHLIPNTVDFALREREEMRDLTKASEIISLHPMQAIASPLSSSAVGFTPPAFSSPFYPVPAKPTRTSSSAIYEDPEKDGQAGWDPRVGQVYLGNSGDVPLAPEVPSHFRHAASVPRGEDEADKWDWEALTSHLKGVDGLMKEYGLDEDELALVPEEGSSQKATGNKLKTKADVSGIPEEDPFNYLATNDPARGYGYDICVECHDLAPFPSTSHLRAADEHLGTLDVMWRERWEKAWLAREEERVRREMEQNGEELQSGEIPTSRIRPPPPAPPRPPPHANAVIHLPFPSSPSNTQATMVALMPVIRFLEKWIQPVPPPLHIVQPTLVPTRPVTPSQTELKNLRMIENLDPKRAAAGTSAGPQTVPASTGSSSRRWSSVTALVPSLASIPGLGHHKEQEHHHQQQHQPVAAPVPPPAAPLPPHPTRMRSMTTPSYQLIQPPTPVQTRTRPLKILLYSSDGYTESSVPALCLLMAIKALNLPEAYLELQVEKRRSFFVYQADLGILRRVEARLREEREREKEKERERERERERMAAGAYMAGSGAGLGSSIINANGKRTAPAPTPVPTSDPPASRIGGFFGSSSSSSQSATAMTSPPSSSPSRSSSFAGRPAAKSVSFAHGPPSVVASASQYMQSTQHQPTPSPMVVPSLTGHIPNHHHPLTSSDTWPGPTFAASAQPSSFPTAGQSQLFSTFGSGSVNAVFTTQQPLPQQQMGTGSGVTTKGRPRASTSPWLPSLFGGDHQSWFNDPRFDGSFPSRVLPFLYLGNLNHASNVYMLHALGITHVVSVGECALVPPPHHMSVHMGGAGYRPAGSSSGAHFVPGKGPGAHGSLWIEEREGRIKVLDIKGVCDDGIDTLEPQLEPICDWIDKARQDGGQVLVHCRVGVSRSATVTIAYVMKHLELPLVDAYLIVRSRRLSVLIQPNMRLLYNLCGWEIKLAKERANGDERKLKKELARTLTWPYLAKEVHALNEKYLH